MPVPVARAAWARSGGALVGSSHIRQQWECWSVPLGRGIQGVRGHRKASGPCGAQERSTVLLMGSVCRKLCHGGWGQGRDPQRQQQSGRAPLATLSKQSDRGGCLGLPHGCEASPCPALPTARGSQSQPRSCPSTKTSTYIHHCTHAPAACPRHGVPCADTL